MHEELGWAVERRGRGRGRGRDRGAAARGPPYVSQEACSAPVWLALRATRLGGGSLQMGQVQALFAEQGSMQPRRFRNQYWRVKAGWPVVPPYAPARRRCCSGEMLKGCGS